MMDIMVAPRSMRGSPASLPGIGGGFAPLAGLRGFEVFPDQSAGTTGPNTGDHYLRPNGADTYLRPNGADTYLRH